MQRSQATGETFVLVFSPVNSPEIPLTNFDSFLNNLAEIPSVFIDCGKENFTKTTLGKLHWAITRGKFRYNPLQRNGGKHVKIIIKIKCLKVPRWDYRMQMIPHGLLENRSFGLYLFKRVRARFAKVLFPTSPAGFEKGKGCKDGIGFPLFRPFEIPARNNSNWGRF